MRKLLAGTANYLRAPASHRHALARALWITPAVVRSLKRNGYSTTRSWLDERPRPTSDLDDLDWVARRVNTAIEALPWPISCLERSLVVWWIAGDDAEIVRGVAMGNDTESHRFHAWVEYNGVVLNDAADIASEFAPLSGRAAETTDPVLFD